MEECPVKNHSNSNTEFVIFKCSACNFEENIPKEVVDFFDVCDGGDPSIPPKFACQKCAAEMSPVYYVNHGGIVYRS
jgi:hypothetical protein